MPKKKKAPLESWARKSKKARTDKKMSYDTLANETGFSIDYLKAKWKPAKTPPVGALLQISRALEIDSGDLLKEEGRMQDRVKAYTKRTSVMPIPP
jgi:transcriptional regulator with XRE-family HTH domain